MSSSPVLGVGAPVAIPGSNWGDLGGAIANQTDLQAALDAKQNAGVAVPVNHISEQFTAQTGTGTFSRNAAPTITDGDQVWTGTFQAEHLDDDLAFEINAQIYVEGGSGVAIALFMGSMLMAGAMIEAHTHGAQDVGGPVHITHHMNVPNLNLNTYSLRIGSLTSDPWFFAQSPDGDWGTALYKGSNITISEVEHPV